VVPAPEPGVSLAVSTNRRVFVPSSSGSLLPVISGLRANLIDLAAMRGGQAAQRERRALAFRYAEITVVDWCLRVD
jgi:hypothetical protein